MDQDLLQAKVARLASLPEQEWRVEIASLVYKLEATNDQQTDMIANVEEALTERFVGIEKTIAEMQVVNAKVLEILNTIQGGLVFFKWVGVAMKWFTIVVGTFTAIFAAIVAGDKALDVVRAVNKIKGGP